MKNTLICLISFLFLFSLASFANAENPIFAFEDAKYSVMINNSIKPKPIAQNITGQLTYTWSSSDENIATVLNGSVKGKSGGSATITCVATAKDGTTYTASCTVQVTIPISSINAEQNNIELAPAPYKARFSWFKADENEKNYYAYKPIVTITPVDATNQTLEWSSASDSVAKVTEDGTIYGIGAGTTTITGKATDGSGRKVQITVTVPRCFVTAQNITITTPEGVTLGYAFAPSSGINTYNMKITGKVITTQSLEEVNGLSMLRLLPVKAGTGTIVFTRNGSAIKTVNIKVEHSAVYDSVSYPPVKVSKLLASPENSIGIKTQVKCEVVKTEKLVIDSSIEDASLFDSDHVGLIYGYVIENNNRQYVIFEHDQAMLFKTGETYTIFGEVEGFIEYTTETGLVYECPYFINGHVN